MNYISRSFIIALFGLFLNSCGNKTTNVKTSGSNKEQNGSTKKMSIEKAESNMFTKKSEYDPAFYLSLTENYRGDIFLQIQSSLERNSLVSVLSDMIIEETGVKDKMYSLIVQKEPIDTLFMDDFDMEDGNIGTHCEIIQVVDFDRLWCGVLSNALTGVKKDENFVRVCKSNLEQLESFYQTIKRKVESNEVGNKHVPILYVYRFSQYLSIYVKSIQNQANYFFTGYSFVYADDMKLGCVIEEFDF